MVEVDSPTSSLTRSSAFSYRLSSSGQRHRVVMVMTIPDVDRHAITAFVSAYCTNGQRGDS